MDSIALSQNMHELYSSLFAATTHTLDAMEIDTTETALSAYEQAITLAPREAVLYYHKGQVLEQLGRNTEAQTAYEAARSLGYAC